MEQITKSTTKMVEKSFSELVQLAEKVNFEDVAKELRKQWLLHWREYLDEIRNLIRSQREEKYLFENILFCLEKCIFESYKNVSIKTRNTSNDKIKIYISNKYPSSEIFNILDSTGASSKEKFVFICMSTIYFNEDVFGDIFELNDFPIEYVSVFNDIATDDNYRHWRDRELPAPHGFSSDKSDRHLGYGRENVESIVLADNFDRLRNQMQSLEEDLTFKAKRAESASLAAIREMEDGVESKLKSANERIEKIDSTIAEQLDKAVVDSLQRHKLSAAIALWSGDARSKFWQFLAGIFTVLVLLFVIPAIGVWKHSYIVEYMAEIAFVPEANTANQPLNSEGSQSAFDVNVGDIRVDAQLGTLGNILLIVGRIAFITIPIIFYFWLTRLAVRYTLRSLVLMDDAKRRSVYLEMFFRIDETGESKELRTKLFDAMTAPMPGHQEVAADLPIAIDKIIDKIKS